MCSGVPHDLRAVIPNSSSMCASARPLPLFAPQFLPISHGDCVLPEAPGSILTLQVFLQGSCPAHIPDTPAPFGYTNRKRPQSCQLLPGFTARLRSQILWPLRPHPLLCPAGPCRQPQPVPTRRVRTLCPIPPRERKRNSCARARVPAAGSPVPTGGLPALPVAPVVEGALHGFKVITTRLSQAGAGDQRTKQAAATVL